MSSESFIDLARFEKKKKIGKGSFGKVYKVEEKSTKQIYAAKIAIKKVDKNSPKEMLDLSREVNIISKLEHPSILKFIGYSPVDFNNKSKPVIITELSTNGSLEQILDLERLTKKIKYWDDTKKLMCIFGIAKGMTYLHSHDIIHRDLKPANIFLDDYLFPKIADFGLSKISNDPSKSVSNLKTTEGEIKGTPNYMAPEIWSSQNYSSASDVYAFSLIIYEIITNKKPFEGYTIYRLLMDVSKNGYRPEITDNIPECYQNLIKSCWSQSPEDRPSFEEIVNLLKNDPSFITDNINNDDYQSYINFLEESQVSFDSTKKLIHLSDFIKTQSKSYHKVSIKKIKKKADDQAKDKSIKEKIVEDENEDIASEIKIINKSVYDKLKNSCRKHIAKAEQNDPSSLFLVAKSFIEGINDFPTDIETGVKYLEFGVKNKNIEVMEYYSKLLFDGDIIDKDEERSVEILTEAANNFNSVNAKYELANIILSHQSFDIDNKNENINYVLAKSYCKEAADGGNVKAMILYARLSSKNKKNKYGEIHSDYNEELAYFKLAAEKGDPQGIAFYGSCIEFGNPTLKGDPNEAIKYYKESYDKDDMTGCAFLGLALFEGKGDLEKNEEDGTKLMKLSSDNNNPYGRLYYAFYSVKDDDDFTFNEIKKVSKMGISFAYYLLGHFYLVGEKVKKDYNLSIKYLKRAIEEGSFEAAFKLSAIYEKDIPEYNIKANHKKVLKYLKYAADHGSINGMEYYAMELSKSGGDPKEIKKYFKMGINLGARTSMHKYALHLVTGQGIPQNFEKGAKYAKMAADLGEIDAMKIYAQLLETGMGVEKNQEEANRYKLMAQGQSNENCLIQ